jgi:predicted nucleic acid-binding protein
MSDNLRRYRAIRQALKQSYPEELSARMAQINAKDLWHPKAPTVSEFIERTNRNVILPAEVLAETLNRIGNNIGRQEAVLAGTALLERNETGDMLITHTNTEILAAMLNLLKTVREPQDKRASFVDCLVMATATFYDTREIFGFDAVFGKNGFHLPGNAEKQAA